MVMVIKATVNKSDYDNILRTYWLKEDIDADVEVEGVLYVDDVNRYDELSHQNNALTREITFT
jgi:hypothetical protein